MKNEKNRNGGAEISLTIASSAGLKGRQSMRATFKLPESTIDAVSIIATHLGIKQKSLFDHLMDDTKSLESVARHINPAKPQKQNRVQKTYVISRRSLSSLEEVAKEYQTPRDVLIEHSVLRLLPLIRQEQKKHESRKKILQDLALKIEDGKKLLAKTKELLGEDDRVYEEISAALAIAIQAYRRIEAFIEKGRMIEQFQTEK
jgi:hypothetical protein